MTKFVVDLGNTNISDEQRKLIAGAIQAAVLPHIAALPNSGGGQLMALSLHAGVCVADSVSGIAAAHADLVRAAGP